MNSKNIEIENHIVRDIIMEELELQLKTFLGYAQKIGAHNSIRSYTQALATLKENRATRPIIPSSRERREAIDHDLVFDAIKLQLKKF